jgi:drug/metabolite transporter (DMT)-like permease
VYQKKDKGLIMKNPGMPALLAGIFLFSTIEVASKLMQTGGGTAGNYPFWLACFRFTITGAVLALPAGRRLRYRQIRLHKRDVLALIGLGLLGVTLMSSLYHSAIIFLPANIAALIFSCNPVFVVLFAPLMLPEKITVRKMAAVGICLTGIGVLAGDRTDGVSVTGVLLMLTAIIIFAIYTLRFKQLTPRYGALPVTAFAALVGGLCILPLALAAEGFPLMNYSTTDWVGIAYLALFGTALGYFLYIYGLEHVEAGSGSMVFFLKPFLAALLAWWILGETLSGIELTGGAFILAGMAVALVPLRRRASAVA